MKAASRTFSFVCIAFVLMASGAGLYIFWQWKFGIRYTGKPLRILDRSEWRGEPPKSTYDQLKTPIKNVVICHTATEGCDNEELCTYRMRIIQTFHMKSLGWNDIGYNFLVGGDGQVYVARGWDTQGRHLKGYGATTLSIAFIGTFTNEQPPFRQVVAAFRLMGEGVRLHKLDADYHIYAERQFSATESPGMALYKIMQNWPRWSPDTKHLTHNNNNTLSIIKREYWLAQPAQTTLDPVQLPAKRVSLLATNTEDCRTQAECTFRVRNIQTYQIESMQKPDIIYNFLISSDGTVFEGRGWSHADGSEHAANDGISLAYIGTYESTHKAPTAQQTQATKLLLAEGVRKDKLIKDYLLINEVNPQTLVDATESPVTALRIVPRTSWLAQPPKTTLKSMELPLAKVLAMSTQTDQCMRQAECTFRVRFLQAFDMERKNEDDISYNFLIGGDGNVYAGLGWNETSATHAESVLRLGFIGSYNKIPPTEQQLSTVQLLLSTGVQTGKLTSDYELIADETNSTATELYASLKKFEHGRA